MSKSTKTLEKLQAKPTPAGIKWTELKVALESLGYKMLNGSGSRRKFFHADKDVLISCHEPHPSPDVGRSCIREIVVHLREHGFLKEK